MRRGRTEVERGRGSKRNERREEETFNQFKRARKPKKSEMEKGMEVYGSYEPCVM